MTGQTPAMPPGTGRAALLEVSHLSKAFGNVIALHDVSLQVHAGEVTAIVGDNGAGKSTLIKCITGVERPGNGMIRFDEADVTMTSPHHARALGIETVFQDLALVEMLTVWENLFLGREITRGLPLLRILRKREMQARTRHILEEMQVDIPAVSQKVARLSGGQRQAIAIGRAVGWGTKVVIMDEPTAALGVKETARVEEVILGLKARGLGVLLVSHDLAQVMRLADRITVLRHGLIAGHRRAADTTGEEIVQLITGLRSEGAVAAPESG